MTLELAQIEAAKLNATICKNADRKAVVVRILKGKRRRLVGHNIQFRLAGDDSVEIDGDYLIEVAA